jgi:tol-pal system protein YbgF
VRQLNKFPFLILMICSLSFAGCATTIDLQEVQGKLDTQIRALGEENAAVRKDAQKNDKTILELRKSIADVAADITEIREDMESLKGDREVLGRGESDMRAEFLRREKESADLRHTLDQLSSRISLIENLLEIGTGANRAQQGEKAADDDMKKIAPPKTEEEAAYDAAYDAFKQEKYEKAREGFQDFLKTYPATEYSDGAQFGIGECYYFERKYEQAILEYEKVIKNYPQGNKVPHALLKQGFSFLNLGDKPSAKLLLDQVVKNYPGTSQARMAKAKLAEIK